MISNIQGQIERVTFHDEENGFTILRLKVPGYRELVTLAGNLMAPLAGQIINATGEWINHPQFGEQFKVVQYKTLVPATVTGIEKYLGSGLVKGIGPVMAKRIVKLFGEETLVVIDETTDRLSEVEGIGEKRLGMIRKAWEDQKNIREVMVFLQGHGVSAGYAAKIYKQYRSQSIEVVKENPYRLAMDIFGIWFVTADRIAENLGFQQDSPVRVQAGAIYVLGQVADAGHVYYPYESLIEKCMEILGVDRGPISQALENLYSEKMIVIENLPERDTASTKGTSAVYLSTFYACETGIAYRMNSLLRTPYSRRKVDAEKAIQWVQREISLSLAPNQVEAVKVALDSKIMVVTGGPGTGKTTIIRAIMTIFERLGVKVLLAAPTGRAAKRMSEATGREAKTIHRMLEFSPRKGGFQRDEKHPLICDLMIVDESSMIDTVLMYHLLKAVPLHAILILIGDVNQLPSVGPGNVLQDIMGSNAVQVVGLTEIFRQAQDSDIIVNAHLINSGVMPSLDNAEDANHDFYFIEKNEPEEAFETIVKLVCIRIQNAFGFDPLDDVQILTPMNRGTVGTSNLNVEFQKALNPREDGIMRGGRSFRVNDKVMQIRNNYDKDVFNGDIGRISKIDTVNQEVTILFDGRAVTYDYSDLDEIVLAYAISIHKSQGSEYPCVVIPLLTQHYVLLQRNLLYTAVTRGKRLVIVVGSKKAMAIAVKNDKPQNRYTLLRERLGDSDRSWRKA
ncbi:MAG: ATP-dependent RecD-like DNA helicase [Syntrophaceae bacterium]|nr:ATP-dependent RecD-like DNA helicase [Syntrophaceae bacterium]